MRLLVTSNFFFPDRPGGLARLAFDLARAFTNLGHEVWLISQAVDGNVRPHECHEGIHVLRYSIASSPWAGIARHRGHAASVSKLLKEYLPDSPDIIHGHDLLTYTAAMEVYSGHTDTLYSIHSPAIEELPIVWGGQGLKGRIKLTFGLRIIKQLEQRALRQSRVLTAESQFTVNLVRRRYGDDIANSIKVIPGWVNLHKYHPIDDVLSARKALDWPHDRQVLFILRRLESRMGLDKLLYALNLVHKRGIAFHAIIGGTGSLEKPLQALSADLNLQSCVTWAGRMPDSTLPLAYAACDATVMPTAQLEGFGLPVVEALACGRPALVTPVGALPEIVRPFEPEWISKSANSADLAELLAAFLTGDLPLHSGWEMRNYASAAYSAELAYTRYASLLNL